MDLIIQPLQVEHHHSLTAIPPHSTPERCTFHRHYTNFVIQDLNVCHAGDTGGHVSSIILPDANALELKARIPQLVPPLRLRESICTSILYPPDFADPPLDAFAAFSVLARLAKKGSPPPFITQHFSFQHPVKPRRNTRRFARYPDPPPKSLQDLSQRIIAFEIYFLVHALGFELVFKPHLRVGPGLRTQIDSMEIVSTNCLQLHIRPFPQRQ